MLAGPYDEIVLNRARPSCVIGRSRNADYHVSHPQISGLQCTLTLELAHSRLLVTDMSTNGTFVDGTVVGRGQACELSNGSTVHFLGANPEEVEDARSRTRHRHHRHPRDD